MKKKYLHPIIVAFQCTLFVFFSCNNQHPTSSIESQSSATSMEVRKINFDKGIYCGLLDSQGNLWFGSAGAGVYRYDGTEFTHFTKNDGLGDDIVADIMEDTEGYIWLGTGNGLSRYNGHTTAEQGHYFTTIRIPQSDTSSSWLDKVYPVLNPNSIHSLAQDNEGYIWIGTGGAGAYRYDPSASIDTDPFTQHLDELGRIQSDSLYHNWISDITVVASGDIWFGSMTHGGASRLDFSAIKEDKIEDEDFVHFSIIDGLADDMVRIIYQDRSGDILFGFNGNRESDLTIYHGQTYTHYGETDGLCNNNIRAIHEDQDGHIWLAGDFGDLCIFDGKNFKEFTSKEGKRYDRIRCVIEDAEGNIWFGGSTGLWRYDGEEVTDMIPTQS